MADDTWLTRAQRCVSLLDPNDGKQQITICLLNKILDSNVSDLYISKDFYNVQQTAGGLPPTMTFNDFVNRVAGHIREELMYDLYSPDRSDDDVRQSLLGIGKWDSNIQYHFRFLNGIVHQIAPGEVHVALYNFILDAVGDDNSIYSCYRDILVDDRR
jgi:hypothetical protein